MKQWQYPNPPPLFLKGDLAVVIKKCAAYPGEINKNGSIKLIYDEPITLNDNEVVTTCRPHYSTSGGKLWLDLYFIFSNGRFCWIKPELLKKCS